MNVTTAMELDPVFRNALKLLHSQSPDSAEKIRKSLDEIIKQRFDSNKMLINTLNKKIIAEERTKSIDEQRKKTVPTPQNQINETTVSTNELPQLPEPMDVSDNSTLDDSASLKVQELDDIMCVVCHLIDDNVKNHLVECSECHVLYHQECHKPPISELDELNWQCNICKSLINTTSSNPTKSSSSHSSSSSSNNHHHHHHKSSSNNKNYESSSSSSSNESKKSKSSSSTKPSKHSSKNRSEHHSSSSSSGGNGGNGSKSSSSVTTPNINIISADKRLQIMKKKAAKLHETKRKHK